MGELLRFDLATPDDVTAVRQLTRDIAREAGLGPLDQTKLAIAVSELARGALASGAAGQVCFSIGGSSARGAARLVAAVTGQGLSATEPTSHSSRNDRVTPGLDLPSIRRLVDGFEAIGDSGADTGVEVAVRLPEAGPEVDHHDLAGRVATLRPRVSAETLERRNVELADALTLLGAQSRELEIANDELQRVIGELAAVNAELALTNRGVLDLNTELEIRADELAAANESLVAGEARQRQLADQQTALADLGRRAMASRDAAGLADDAVEILRAVLGVEACGILRFAPGTPRLDVIAAAGCPPGHPTTIPLSRPQARRLQEGGIMVADLTTGSLGFPFPAPPDARSAALVVVPTPGGPWVAVAACHTERDHFGGPETAFMEAAASLLASSMTRTAIEDAAHHAALHDALTGLPNRAQLLHHLGRALGAHPPRPGHADRRVAVIFVDLDGFKQVNDTLGHAAGDLVLVETAERLSDRTRPTDTLARLGGDEFVVLCEVADEAAAAAIAQRLLGAFDEPFTLEGREVFLAGSAGVALAAPGVSGDQVLADADLAMYRAKQTSGCTTIAFRPEMRGRVESEGLLHNELRRARERGELRAVYQPVVDLADGTVRGVEALLRWRHPELGDVPADRTVAAAERLGLAWDFTSWIAAEAASAIGAWNGAHPDHPPLRLAVNLTPLLLDSPKRIDDFEALVTEAGLPFHLLDVELTETAFADPTPEVLASIGELRRRGARLAMDDFGTGYSSLIALANLPFDVLKIDRSFVTPLDRRGDTLLVSAMTGIARGRRLRTVGEGIETEGQLAALIDVECDLGQGYLFAKPLEHADLTALITLEEGFAEIVRRVRLSAAGRPVPPPGAPRTPLRPARVLVVEDNPADLQLLRVLLGSAGYDITEVSDPVAFMAALQSVQPDLVLMDLRLKGTSGFDLVEQAEPLLDMPVVAVTGYPDWVVDHDQRSRHFTSVVSKPVEPGALLARLDCLLADRSPHQAKTPA